MGFTWIKIIQQNSPWLAESWQVKNISSIYEWYQERQILAKSCISKEMWWESGSLWPQATITQKFKWTRSNFKIKLMQPSIELWEECYSVKIKKYLEAQKCLARDYFQWWTKGLYTFCYQMQMLYIWKSDFRCFISENTSTVILRMAELLQNFKAFKSRYWFCW